MVRLHERPVGEGSHQLSPERGGHGDGNVRDLDAPVRAPTLLLLDRRPFPSFNDGVSGTGDRTASRLPVARGAAGCGRVPARVLPAVTGVVRRRTGGAAEGFRE